MCVYRCLRVMMVDLCIILGVAVRVCSVSLFVQLLEKGGLISCHKFAQKCFSPIIMTLQRVRGAAAASTQRERERERERNEKRI